MLYWHFTQKFCKFSAFKLDESFINDDGLLLYWHFTQKFCKFSAFNLEFENFFSITRTFFSHSRSKQFWIHNMHHFQIPMCPIFISLQFWLKGKKELLYIPCVRHYNPRFLNFLTTFWSPKMFFQGIFFLKFWPSVWLAFKSTAPW